MIEIQGLSISYKDRNIIENTDICIENGDFIYFAGKSGVGKSTLLEYLSGVLEKTSNALIRYESYANSFSSIRHMLQNVSSQFFYFKVYDELKHAIGINYKGNFRKRVMELAEKWEIMDFLERKIFTLSSGEQQLLLLIAISIEKPELLLLDEPTSFLDVKKKEIALNILKDHNKTGGTIMISNHKSREMRNFSGKFYFLDKQSISTLKWPFDKYKPENYGLFPEDKITALNKNYSFGEDILTISNVCFSYSRKDLLINVNANIRMGEWIQLSGLNGSGKSTLLKLILGELKPQKGKIKRHKRLSFQFLSQNYRFYTRKETILDEISGFDSSESMRLIDLLRISNIINNDIFKLSCGEAKRAMILFALLNKPDVLIIDEPESGLDFEVLKIIMDLLYNLVVNGKLSIINVSHEDWIGKKYASTKWAIKDCKMEVSYY